MKTLITIVISLSTSIFWYQTNVRVDCSITAVNLLGQSPHVPFTVINNGTISSARQFHCKEWANNLTD